MAKGWKKLTSINEIPQNTESEVQKNRRNQNFKVRTSIMKSLSLDDMKKRGDESFAKKVADDDHLLDALKRQAIKDEATIKRAEQIKKDREKEAAKAAKKAAKAAEKKENK